MLRRPCGSLIVHATTGASLLASVWASRASYLVRFAPTPNDDCMRFYVEGVSFLSTGSAAAAAVAADGHHGSANSGINKTSQKKKKVTASLLASTLSFDQTNKHQSPLADVLITSLPMIDEVTIGHDFVTIRRLEKEEYRDRVLDAAHAQEEAETTEEAARDDIDDDGKHTATNTATTAEKGTTEPEETVQSSSCCSPPSSASQPQPKLDDAALETIMRMLDWSELKMTVCAVITDHMYSGAPHVALDAPHPHQDTIPHPDDSEVVACLKELISETIRPELQKDGGDIRYLSFRADTDKHMEVELLGACKTCKSSKSTLQDLIERTTRHYVPEVLGVAAFIRKRQVASPAAAAAESSGSSSSSVLEHLVPLK